MTTWPSSSSPVSIQVLAAEEVRRTPGGFQDISRTLLSLPGVSGGVDSTVLAVLLASLAAVFTRTLTMEDAYRSIHWSSLVLVAGMLPLADALERTGGTFDFAIEGAGFFQIAGPQTG